MITYARGQFDLSKTSDASDRKAGSSNNFSIDSDGGAQERISARQQRYGRNPMAVDSSDVIDSNDRYTMEGGDFAPLLPPERYKGRVLSASSLRRRRKPGLLVDRQEQSNRPRVVVDGVDDLRDSVTGLFARRVEGLDFIPDGKSDGKDDFLSMDPSYEFTKAQQQPLDDRITPQTLHLLLRNTRATVARLHPPSLKRNKYYSFASSMKGVENILNELEDVDPTTEHASVERDGPPVTEEPAVPKAPAARARTKCGSARLRPKLEKGSRMVAKGETPGDFMRRTGIPKPEATESALTHRRSSRSEIYDQYVANQIREMQRNDVHFLEQPNLTLAHGAKYYPTARDDEAPPDGIGITAPTLPLQTKHPVEKCMVYPPVPIRYASKEEEKRAMTLKRLAPRQGVRRDVGVKKEVENEHVKNLIENESKETFTLCDDGRTPEQAQFLEYTFSTASRGEDTNFIEQLVRGFSSEKQKLYERIVADRKRRRVLPTESPTKNNLRDRAAMEGAPRDVSEPVFSVLEATLTVSREFEKIKQGKSNTEWIDSCMLSQDRRVATERLTSFGSTRIPEQYWVTIQERNLLSKNRSLEKRESQQNATPDEEEPEVELKMKQGRPVAEWIDSCMGSKGRGTDSEAAASPRHTHAPEHNSVPNPEQAVGAATAVESESFTNAEVGEEAEVGLKIVSRVCNASRGKRRHADVSILFPATKPVGRAQVYLLAETIDFMLNQNKLLDALTDSNIARQILPCDPHSDNPPSDLDNPLLLPEIQHQSDKAHLRYTTAAQQVIETIDIGLVELVRQVGSTCIERGALLDALRQTLVDVANSSVRVLRHAKEVAFHEASTRYALRNEMKRLENLVAEQASNIRELEKEKQRLLFANDALQLKATRMDLLLERIEAKRKRYELHSEDEHACLLQELEEDMIKTASKAVNMLKEEKAALKDGPNQPSGEAPTAAEARKRVWDTKTAMQTLYTESAYLLKELHSATTSMNSACAPLYDEVALSALSPNANLVAAKWAAIAHAVGEFEKEKSHRQRVFQVFTDWCERFRKERKAETAVKADEGEFLVMSSPENSGVESLLDDSAASFMSFNSHEGNKKKKSKDEDKEPEENKEEVRLQFITRQDLLEMHVFDCSPEEVNAMFERKFDFKSFLHTPWEPSSSNFTLNLTDVADMVHDVRVFLQEVTIRMDAMCNSAVMQKGIEPPLQPPAHPDIPCPLCDRREMTGEKRKRQDALQNIAREMQRRMDELNRRCQKAESEREDARGEARRMQQELETALEREDELKAHLNELVRAKHSEKRIPGTPGTPPLAPMRSIIKGAVSGLPNHKKPLPHPAGRAGTNKVTSPSPNDSASTASFRTKRRRSSPVGVEVPPSDAPLPREETLGETMQQPSDLETTDELTVLQSKNTTGTHADDDVPERSKSEVLSQATSLHSTTESTDTGSSTLPGSKSNKINIYEWPLLGTQERALRALLVIYIHYRSAERCLRTSYAAAHSNYVLLDYYCLLIMKNYSPNSPFLFFFSSLYNIFVLWKHLSSIR
eukprot:gene4283-3099_t